MGWEETAEELYGLPPEEFTAARDRAAGGLPRDQAALVRRLRRPTVAAWTANLIARRDPGAVGALGELGGELRRAHADLDGELLRELVQRQRQVVAALSRQAKQLAAEAGRPVGEAVLREVEATVLAALAGPDAAREFAAGRLATALRPPTGFGPAGTAEAGPGAETAPSARPSPRRRGAGGGTRTGEHTGTARRPRADAPGRTRGTAGQERDQERRRAREEARGQRRDQERKRREELAEARTALTALKRTAKAREHDAARAERALAAERERREQAKTRVAGLAGRLRAAEHEAAGAKEAENAARVRAEEARTAADRARDGVREATGRLERLSTRARG